MDDFIGFLCYSGRGIYRFWKSEGTKDMRKSGMRLKTRIRGIMIAMLILVVALNTAIILFYIAGSLKETAEQSMRSVNEQKMITIENLMDTFVTLTQKPLIDDTILEILKRDYEEYPEQNRKFYMYKDRDAMDERLYTEMFYKNEYIYAVTLFSENEEYVYSKQRSGKGVLDINLRECSWFRALEDTDGTEAVLFPYMEDDLYRGGEPVIAVGRLLKDPMTNRALGVIRVDIAVKDLERVCGNEDEAAASEVIFLDSGKNLLYTSLPVDRWKEEYGKKIEKNLAVTAYSDKYGMSIATLIPRNQVYKGAYRTIWVIVGITLGCVVLALFISGFVVNTSLKPIGDLNELMKEVRSGDLSVRARVQAGDEFEEVCESFNLMVENTEKLIERVRREEIEKGESEYRALQAQISPHFILNTINMIKWMAVIQGNKAIEKALDSFAHVLTFVVRRQDEKIPIGVQVEQMRYYVDILSLRYYNRFQIDFEVDERAKNCYSIKYVLQTLIENSVFHGFDDSTGPGIIQVKICRQDERIIYEVKDNGKGMTVEKIEEALSRESDEVKGMMKIGIYNINRRIQLIYGEPYGVSIKSVPGEFTSVRVVIPAEEESNG